MAQQSDMIRVSFSSEGATAFVATCEVTRLGQVEERVIAEETPFELSVAADALDCLVRAEGPLSVEMVSSAGTRSQTRTSGGTLRIILR